MASADYEVLGQLAPANTDAATLYTVAAGKRVVTSTLTVANISAAAATYDIAIRPAAEGLANKHYIAKGVSLSANSTDYLAIGITLEATDVVTVKSGTGDAIAFNMFGTVITP